MEDMQLDSLLAGSFLEEPKQSFGPDIKPLSTFNKLQLEEWCAESFRTFPFPVQDQY